MKSADPHRYDTVMRILDKNAEGVFKDEISGRKLEVADEDREIELEVEDILWTTLFEEIQGAIGENGLPIPQEEDHVLMHRWGIRDPENLRFTRSILREMCYGRNEGLNTKFEKPKGGKKPGKQPGKQPRR